LAIAGSQVVGLVPLKVMLDAADYYMAKEDLFIVDEDQKLRLVRKLFYRMHTFIHSVKNPFDPVQFHSSHSI
jgi:hypothetical protein